MSQPQSLTQRDSRSGVRPPPASLPRRGRGRGSRGWSDTSASCPHYNMTKIQREATVSSNQPGASDTPEVPQESGTMILPVVSINKVSYELDQHKPVHILGEDLGDDSIANAAATGHTYHLR
ncbi:hypothetical protein V496_06894 [Pseudogymnoascus sp. VKM F-4515 (FW-2607)]|nr:hypothetical protein V496_06894 [Pseudogymnoascus sp. VKM F-4515 (FW-2607)]